jgi:hypothetical protein
MDHPPDIEMTQASIAIDDEELSEDEEKWSSSRAYQAIKDLRQVDKVCSIPSRIHFPSQCGIGHSQITLTSIIFHPPPCTAPNR